MKSKIKVGFRYELEQIRDGKIISIDHAFNLVPTEGLDYIVTTILKNGTPAAAWYIALYEGNYTPVAGVTAATIVAAATECSAYAETTRQAWTGGTVAAGAVDNSAARAAFTMNATKNVYGAFLVSSSTKGGGTGTLLSAVRFPTVKALASTDVFRVTAGLVMISA